MRANFFRRLPFALLVYGALGLALWLCPITAGMNFNVHGVGGWLTLFLAMIAGSVVYSGAASFCKGLFSYDLGTPDPRLVAAARIVGRTIGGLCLAGVFLTLARIMPANFETTSNIGLYIFTGSFAFASAVFDVLTDRFAPNSK